MLNNNKDDLPVFMAGTTWPSPFSADVMNRIVENIARLLKIEGANGIKVKYSDANIVISFEPEETPEDNSLSLANSTVATGSASTGNTYNCVCRWN